jgi:glycerol-3-phosphate dehydrogenase
MPLRMPVSSLDGRTYDVAIVGAGINGCTAAQHLAAEGYSVVLLDKGDFGGGATSRSGRTLHCGLQILAPKKSVSEFLARPVELFTRLRLARRTAEDHAELCEIMAERLRPTDIAVPIYRRAGYSGWHVDVGARLIRHFNKGRSAIGYRRWKVPSQSPHPFVKALRSQENLASVIAFVDQRVEWPERTAIDAALNAEDIGAVVRNFARVVSFERSSGGLWHIGIKDCLAPRERANLSACVVLNLAGAWVDGIIRLAPAQEDITRKVIAVKGVYLLVRLPSEYRGAGVAGINRVGEPICCLPCDDLHYIGPTETLFEGELEDVRPDEDDIRFLIEEFNHLVPALPVTRRDVVMAWAGVRAITRAQNYPKGKRLAFNVLHDLGREGLPNMFALSWGIIVHHRSTARDIVAAVSERIVPSLEKQPTRCEVRRFPPSSSPRLQEDHRATLDDVRRCLPRETH